MGWRVSELPERSMFIYKTEVTKTVGNHSIPMGLPALPTIQNKEMAHTKNKRATIPLKLNQQRSHLEDSDRRVYFPAFLSCVRWAVFPRLPTTLVVNLWHTYYSSHVEPFLRAHDPDHPALPASQAKHRLTLHLGATLMLRKRLVPDDGIVVRLGTLSLKSLASLFSVYPFSQLCSIYFSLPGQLPCPAEPFARNVGREESQCNLPHTVPDHG